MPSATRYGNQPAAAKLQECTVEYERIENIVPARREELLADLRERLGRMCEL